MTSTRQSPGKPKDVTREDQTGSLLEALHTTPRSATAQGVVSFHA